MAPQGQPGVNGKVLISMHDLGLGDVLQARPVLHALALAHPRHRLVAATLPRHRDALIDHPDLAAVRTDRPEPFRYDRHYDLAQPTMISCQQGWNTTDTYLHHLGLELDGYDLHFRLPEEAELFARNVLNNKKTVALCPVSSTRSRDLTPEALHGLCEALLGNGWQVIALHTSSVPGLPQDVLQPSSLSIPQLVALHKHVDACITTDTSHSHLSGGLQKPGVHVYTVQCGYRYTKHYLNAKVVQHHPRGTRNPYGTMNEITAEEILDAFKELAT